MNKIYQCEDSIEQGKFLLAALKIESGFLNLNNLAQRKQTNYLHTFLFKLNIQKHQNILYNCQKGFNVLEDTVDSIKDNKKRNCFHTILCYSQKEDRKSINKMSRDRSEYLRGSHDRSDFGGSVIKSVSVIEEQNWKDKMTLEQLQASCDYYSMKIKEVDKSFSEFFHVIKNQ